MTQTTKNVSPFSNQKRNTYVIEHITDELLRLLKEKELSEISISELCKLAGVGRASFYRNFKNKEDVLRHYIHKLLSQWAKNESSKDLPLSESLALLFRHFEKHKNFYSLLNERNLSFLIKEVILSFYGPKSDQTAEEAYACAFVAYTLYGWIELWFQRGMQESSADILVMFKAHDL